MEIKKTDLTTKIAHEIHLFLLYAAFLTFFFCALTIYRRLILREYAIDYLHYGSGVIQALILSKIILLGQSMNLGEKLKERPLIIPTLYKTLIFSIWVLVFSLFEHFIVGFIHGTNFKAIYTELIDRGIAEILAKVLVVSFVFILFFAFLELGKALGEKKLVNLFFGPKAKDDADD